MAYNLDPHTSGNNQSSSYERRPTRAVHSVRPGETLDSIAKQHGTSSARLIQLNSHQLGSNGAGLQPDMRLEV
jgi:LysM repeat protein